jgi:putative transposase
MSEIITLFSSSLNPILNRTLLNQLILIAEAMIAMSGRVTMLGLSRWTEKGGSYRTIQRFFSTEISWPSIKWQLARCHHLQDKESVKLVAGDTSTVTKSGKKTYGIGRFFSSLYGKSVPGIEFLTLSVIDVNSRTSSPIITKQVIKSEVKVPDKKTNKKKTSTKKGKPGRPQGSKNKNRKDVELSKYLLFVQATLNTLLSLINTDISVVYFVFDGAFGNNEALQMARKCNLHLVSKLRYDSALFLPFMGKYKGRGPRRKYGKKLDCHHLASRYLKSSSVEDDIRTCIYQAQVWHKLFVDMLNVVIITKTHLKTGTTSHVILFSSDLELVWDKMIEYYQLRFQIEFNFRDAKQFWGLEDFMNIKQTQVYNAANLSLFMVNLSQALLQKKSAKFGQSINDLKSWFRASKYVQRTLKLLGKNPDPILIESLTIQISQMGRVA